MNNYFKFYFLSVVLTLVACGTENKSTDSDSSIDTATSESKDTSTDFLDSSGNTVDTSVDTSDKSTDTTDKSTDTTDTSTDTVGSYTKDEMSQIACDMLKECSKEDYALLGGDDGCATGFKTNFFTENCDIYNGDKAFMCAESINTCDELMAELNQTAVNVQCDAMCEDFSDSDSMSDTGSDSMSDTGSDTTVVTVNGSVSLDNSGQTGGTGHVCVGLFAGGCPDMLQNPPASPTAGNDYFNVTLNDTTDVQPYSIDLSENMSSGTYGLGTLFSLTGGNDCYPQSGDYYGCSEFNVTVDNVPPDDIPVVLDSVF